MIFEELALKDSLRNFIKLEPVVFTIVFVLFTPHPAQAKSVQSHTHQAAFMSIDSPTYFTPPGNTAAPQLASGIGSNLWNVSAQGNHDNFQNTSRRGDNTQFVSYDGNQRPNWNGDHLRNSNSYEFNDHVIHPVPEVETYSMMLAGLVMISLLARSRRTYLI
jgi:hypothetical protein